MHTAIPGAPRFLDLILEGSWQAGLLVLLVLAVQRLLGHRLSPAWRHALWWIVLGRLLIPVTPPSPWSLFNLLPDPRVERTVRADFMTGDSDWRPILSNSPTFASTSDPRPGNSTAEGIPVTPAPLVPVVRAPATFATLGNGLALVWAAGAFFHLSRLVVQNARFSRRVRERMTPAEFPSAALLEECRVRMGVRRRIELLHGDAVSTPAIYGILNPRLLLPRRLAETSPPERLRHIFLHELAHVRRGDLLIHGVTRVLQALHWFNPVLAWAFRRLRADRELATDSLALQIAGEGESRAYGLTIVAMLESWAVARAQPGAIGMVEDNASLERRIRAIANYRPPRRWAPETAFLLVGLAAMSWTSAQPAKAPAEPKPIAANSEPATPSIPRDVPAAKQAPKIVPIRTDEAAERTNSHTTKGRQLIQSRLESIRIPEMGFDRLPLEMVVRQLRDTSRVRDPAGKGINFFINPYFGTLPGSLGNTFNPHTGEEIQPGQPEPTPLGDVMVRVEPPLRDVRLIDALQVITQSAEAPITFSVEDYAVVFNYKAPKPRITRVFRVDPDRFARSLQELARIQETNDLATPEAPATPQVMQEKVRRLFQELEVSLVPPNAIFFNDRLGLLMVRATIEEMEILENAIEALNAKTLQSWQDIPALPPDPDDQASPDKAGNSANVESLNQYAQAVARLDELLTRHRDKWPAVIEARARVDELRAKLTNGLVVHPLPPAYPKEPESNQLLIFREGLWMLNNRVVPDAQRGSRFRELASAKGEASRPLQIFVEPASPMSQVVAALDHAKAAGIRNVNVSEIPLPKGEGFHLVRWRAGADVPQQAKAGSNPILVAFEANWSFESAINSKVLQSFRLQRLFESTDTALYRVDCTQDDALSRGLKESYGIRNLPAYAVYHPGRKAWTVLQGTLTEGAIAELLKTP